LFQRHNYPRFVELSEQCDVQIKLQIENKTKSVPPIRGQSSSVVTELSITSNNNNNNNNNNGDNRSSNPSDFVTSSSSVTSTSSNVDIDTSNNVVSVATPSFVPSDIEQNISLHYYNPSIPFADTSDSPPTFSTVQ
jgi:hypothetical protein